MEFVLCEGLHSFRYSNYTFLPKKVVSVCEDNDINYLLNSTKVKPYNFLPKEKLSMPIQEKKAKEGQLKIGALRVGGLGDTLQLGAHAKAIKRKFPDCFLTVYVRDKVDAELMESNSYVDKIYQVGVAGWDSIVALHSVSHDIFYDFRYAVKVIFNTKLFAEYKAMTEKMFTVYEKIYKDFCKSNFEIEKHGMNLIDFSNMIACIEGNEDDLTFDLNENKQGYARLLENQKYVTLHISGGKYRVTKSWDVNRWAEIASYLQGKGYTIVQVGSKGETLVSGAISMLDLPSLQETAWLLHGAQFHIDTEGGLVHLAKAVKTPSVVIFGATPLESFGYYDNINLRTKNCKPCWYKTEEWYTKCPDGHAEPKCLKDITVDMVKEGIDKLDSRYKVKRVTHKKDNPLVSIVIPVHNQFKYLEITINSILSHTKEDFELVIIDNASDKEVKDYLNGLKSSKMINIITNEKNLIFGKANNQGAKIARGEYICFLNSDVKVGDGWLSKLFAGYTEQGGGLVGVAGGKLDNECRCAGITRDPEDRYDYLEGWCLFTSKKTFDEVGCFDEEFIAFSEDADLSLRFRRRGFKTNIIGGINIQHYANKTVFSQTDFDVTKVSMESSKRLKNKLKEKQIK